MQILYVRNYLILAYSMLYENCIRAQYRVSQQYKRNYEKIFNNKLNYTKFIYIDKLLPKSISLFHNIATVDDISKENTINSEYIKNIKGDAYDINKEKTINNEDDIKIENEDTIKVKNKNEETINIPEEVYELDAIISKNTNEMNTIECYKRAIKQLPQESEVWQYEDIAIQINKILTNKNIQNRKKQFKSILLMGNLLNDTLLRSKLQPTKEYRVLLRQKSHNSIDKQIPLYINGMNILHILNIFNLQMISSDRALYLRSVPSNDTQVPIILIVDANKFTYSITKNHFEALGISSNRLSRFLPTVERKRIKITPDSGDNDQWHKCFSIFEFLFRNYNVLIEVSILIYIYIYMYIHTYYNKI